jgi:hypothetical protein
MTDVLKWFQDAKVWVGALIGALVSLSLGQAVRATLKRRLLMAPAMMPSFTLNTGDGKATLTVFGEYGVVNMSDLPISVRPPHLTGYNAASRAFQFNAGGVRPVEDLLKEVVVPPSNELRLISQGSWAAGIERYCVRWPPVFIWLETLQGVRIGRKRALRWRAHLYRASLYSPDGKDVTYVSTSVETSANKARLLALPGKLLARHRWNKS